MNLTREQIIFIVAVAVVMVSIIAIIIVVPIRKKSIRRSFDMHYYRKINQIVTNNDYYLVNKFTFRTADAKVFIIDHIVGGEKFIYVICDFYIDGDLMGNLSDHSLIHVNKVGKKSYTDNPIAKVDSLVKKFIQVTMLDPTFIVGIAIVNDECKLSINGNSSSYFIVQRRRLASLIKAVESRDVGKINEDQLQSLINTIDKMNRKKRK